MPSAAALNVLVVDDYPTMRRIIRNLLGQLGFSRIEEAGNGEAALQRIKAGRIDLVISDWNMEPMTGLDLVKSLRAEDSTKELPFIMVTAEGKVENVAAAKAAGVDNYIVKPFNAATLKSKIEVVIGALQ